MNEMALPPGWENAALSELIQPVLSKDPALEPETEFTYFDISSIDSELGIVTSPKHMVGRDAPSRARRVVQAGDVLFPTVRPYLRAIARVPPTDNGLASTGFCVLRASKLFSEKFLFFFVRSDGFLDGLLPLQRGVSYPAVRDGDVLAQIVPVPPAGEQTRIVEKIEELLSDLDSGVAELKAAQMKIIPYRQSLLKTAMEGTLTAEWRKYTQSTETGAQLLDRILREHRARWETKQIAKLRKLGKIQPLDLQKKYPEPIKPTTSDLPDLPEGWVWASVEQIGDVQLGRQRSPNKIGGANPTPYIRAANITESGIDLGDVLEMDFSASEKETFALKAGDVLLTEASGSPEHVGRPAIWKEVPGLYCFQNTVLRFSPRGVSSKFAYLSFLAMQKLGVFSFLSEGIGINHLSAGKFSKLPIALPPADEQRALVDTLEQKLLQLDEQFQSISHSLKQSAVQRKNILRSAFLGHLVSQDPNDETASQLLDRIQAERAGREQKPKMQSAKQKKEVATVLQRLIDVLTEARDWVPAQEAFRRCGVTDGAQTEQIEALYAELRDLDKAGRLIVEVLTDAQGRKLQDRLKLVMA